MVSGAVFIGYDEGPVIFNPTYRYNLGTDTYDTSEKMRIPAWTGEHYSMTGLTSESRMFVVDRILYRGTDLDLSVYSKADLRSSDHRPGEHNG